jgi:Flp pilus assembly protein TadG
MLRQRNQAEQDSGQILVLFAMGIVVLLAFAALVIDIGLLRNDRQSFVNALDAGALAGGTLLPVNGASEGAAANSLIDGTVAANYRGLSEHTITYRCLIGLTKAGQPDLSQVTRGVCDPKGALGHIAAAADFVGAGSVRTALCDPQLGDTCNVVVITGSATTAYGFARVVGVDNGSTGTVVSAACSGPCGASLDTPVDLVVIMDRTGSMEGSDTTDAKAAADALVASYDPSLQWIGLSLLGPSVTSSSCLTSLASGISQSNMGSGLVPEALRRWVPVGLSGEGSSISSTYAKVTAGLACYNTGNYTDLADPVSEATYELLNNGRTGVRKGIILLTDGQPNSRSSSGPYSTGTVACNNANSAATAAKAAGIEVFAIAFGLDGANNADCNDTTGTWSRNGPGAGPGTAAQLLVSMASDDPATGDPAVDRGCPGPADPALNSNNDGDHYFCIPKGAGATTDLKAIFVAAAAQLARGGNHLIQVFPTPVVTGVSGGTTVTISGKFLSGALSVTFGGAPATVLSNGDTSITATAPAGTPGRTVDVIVTTLGGSSPITSADRYTYP